MLLQLNDDVLEKVLSFPRGATLPCSRQSVRTFGTEAGSRLTGWRCPRPRPSESSSRSSSGRQAPGFRCEDGILRFRRANDVRAECPFSTAPSTRTRPHPRLVERGATQQTPLSTSRPRGTLRFLPRRPASAVRRHFDAPTSSRLFRKRGISAVCVSARLATCGSLPRQQHLAPLTLPANDPPYVPPPVPAER